MYRFAKLKVFFWYIRFAIKIFLRILTFSFTSFTSARSLTLPRLRFFYFVWYRLCFLFHSSYIFLNFLMLRFYCMNRIMRWSRSDWSDIIIFWSVLECSWNILILQSLRLFISSIFNKNSEWDCRSSVHSKIWISFFSAIHWKTSIKYKILIISYWWISSKIKKK